MVPGGLAEMPPGPELAAVLAGLDLTRLHGADLFEVLAAQDRQVSHEQARLLATIWEACRSVGDGQSLSRAGEPDEFGFDQIGFELHWSGHHARAQVHLARTLLLRLPVVYTELSAGRIDYARAAAFADALALLDDDVARQIVDRLIDRARGQTLAQLRDALRYHVKKADPALAKRRHRHAVAARRVWVNLDDDGTANLTGTGLPPDRTAAAYDRLDRLARAARTGGDQRNLEQLRADALLDLVTGHPFAHHPHHDPVTRAADQQATTDSHTDDQPLPPLVQTYRAHQHTDADLQPIGAATLADPQPADHPRSHTGTAGPVEFDPADDSWSETGITTNPTDPQPDTPAEMESEVEFDPADDSWFETGTAGPEPLPPPPPLAAGDDGRLCTCGRIQPASRRGNADIRIEMTTLMRLNRYPGIIPGWGPVIADVARQIALDPVAQPTWRISVTDTDGNLLHHVVTRRRPTTAEANHVRARDLTCRAPGCRRPAIRCDADHRLEYARGGAADRENLCCLCRHHHRLRHERGHTTTPGPGLALTWTCPNGRSYTVEPDHVTTHPRR
jgi:hypothetical protein